MPCSRERSRLIASSRASARTARSGAARRSTSKTRRSSRSRATRIRLISRGRLCPKGSASEQFVNSPGRQTAMLYRRAGLLPSGNHSILETATDMIADRVLDTRNRDLATSATSTASSRSTAHTWHRRARWGDAGQRRELPDQESCSPPWVRCRSRIRPVFDTAPPSPVWGLLFGRGGATTFQQDLQNSDCIVIQGSNMAECHPVGFQWVMEAKARGAKIIHIDPRFTRTSAVCGHARPDAGRQRHRVPRRESINYILEQRQMVP